MDNLPVACVCNNCFGGGDNDGIGVGGCRSSFGFSQNCCNLEMS